jgi:hypothetical protein
MDTVMIILGSTLLAVLIMLGLCSAVVWRVFKAWECVQEVGSGTTKHQTQARILPFRRKEPAA